MDQAQQPLQLLTDATNQSQHLHQSAGPPFSVAMQPATDRSAAQPQPHPQQPAVAASGGAATPSDPVPPQQQTVVDLVDPKEAAISMLRGQGASAEMAAEAVNATQDVFVSTDAMTCVINCCSMHST